MWPELPSVQQTCSCACMLPAHNQYCVQQWQSHPCRIPTWRRVNQRTYLIADADCEQMHSVVTALSKDTLILASHCSTRSMINDSCGSHTKKVMPVAVLQYLPQLLLSMTGWLHGNEDSAQWYSSALQLKAWVNTHVAAMAAVPRPCAAPEVLRPLAMGSLKLKIFSRIWAKFAPRSPALMRNKWSFVWTQGTWAGKLQ